MYYYCALPSNLQYLAPRIFPFYVFCKVLRGKEFRGNVYHSKKDSIIINFAITKDPSNNVI